MQAPLISLGPPAAPRINWGAYFSYFLNLVLLGLIIYGVYWITTSGAFRGAVTQSVGATDLVGSPLDGKQFNTVSGAQIPAGVLDYSVQFWMYIQDWDYKFGQEKVILRRGDPTTGGIVGPQVSLSPNENTMNVSVSIHPGDANTQRSEPAPANTGGSATGDIFTCSVENVPLQAWFSVSVTVFQRNLDIYINGKLVKSCILPGVPKTAAGDIEIGPEGGFSGYICNLYSYARMLAPSDALAFYGQGTYCSSITPKGEESLSGNLFGYTVKMGLYDQRGKAIRQYVF